MAWKLAVDIGTTKIKVGLGTTDIQKAWCKDTWDEALSIIEQYLDKVAKVFIISVRDTKLNITTHRDKFVWLTQKTPTPIQWAYDGLGVDRRANMIAGYKMLGSPLLVIDMGTATTVDLLVDRKHQGGLILPGVSYSCEFYRKKLSHLNIKPDFMITEQVPLIGRSTNECAAAGIVWGEVTRIEGIIQRFKQQTEGVKIIFTGGWGWLGAKFMGYRYDVHLTLRGILWWGEWLSS